MFKYRLLFNPQPLPGFSLEQVQNHLRQLLKLTDAQLRALYMAPDTVLKKDLDKDKAEAYRQYLAGYGIAVTLEPQLELEAGPAPVPPALPASTPDTAAPPPLAPERSYLGEQLAAADRPAPNRERRVAMRFTGTGSEYFGIWIVNVVLSILTLGIYSAWAKVRNRQYFYGHSILDHNNFQYLANPLTILKGRILAFVALLAWNLSQEFMPLLSLVLLLIFLPLFPWVLARSLRFNAINTAYRGVRFNFQGSYGGAAMVTLLWPFISMITFALGLPLALQQKHKYQVENSRYGLAAFSFDGTVPAYYLFGLKLLGTLLVALFLGIKFHPVFLLAGYLVMFGLLQSSLTNLYLGNVRLAGHRIESRLSVPGMLWIYFSNSILIMLTLGLFIPWAKVRMARYRAECTTIIIAGDLDKFVGGQLEQVNALGEELGEMFDMDIAII